MKKIIHLSDLHFGAINKKIVNALPGQLEAIDPDLIVISGDLTQRAKKQEFQHASAFINTLPAAKIIVPGNHDIPLYNIYKRFRQPLKYYHRYIESTLLPFEQQDFLAVLGINTSRSLTWKNGRISFLQMQQIAERFQSIPHSFLKILVTHHPFIPPAEKPGMATVGRGHTFLSRIKDSHIDILLAGHNHMNYTGHTVTHYTGLERSLLVIQAGTATSTRTRTHVNSFNLLRCHPDQVYLSVYHWDGTGFHTGDETHFRQEKDKWTR